MKYESKPTLARLAAFIICLAVVCGTFAPVQADEMKQFSTRDLEAHLRKTEKELKTMRDLEKKLDSASRQSSNSARQKVVTQIQDHMGECILRREDDLGQDHTIKEHGKNVTSGTTDAAEVGAPVGTKSAKNSLMYKEGIAGMRLRQLSRLQSIYVSAKHNQQGAIEKQADSLERFTDKTRRFREELEHSVNFINDELDRRRMEKEAAEQAGQ